MDMTIKDGKYPNKEDLDPKKKKNNKVSSSDELPLADPAESNVTHEFHEGEQHLVEEGKTSKSNQKHKD